MSVKIQAVPGATSRAELLASTASFAQFAGLARVVAKPGKAKPPADADDDEDAARADDDDSDAQGAAADDGDDDSASADDDDAAEKARKAKKAEKARKARKAKKDAEEKAKKADEEDGDEDPDDDDDDDEDEEGDDDDDRREMRGHSKAAKARAHERGRVAAIMNSPHAVANLQLAMHLACNTTQSRDAVIATLAAAAAGGGTSGGGLGARMNNAAVPRVPVGNVSGGGGQRSATASSWDASARRNGILK